MSGTVCRMAQRRFGIEDLRSATDPVWFQRGQQYFEQGRVRRLRNEPGKVSAVVSGSRDYVVRLSSTGGVLADSCTCPLGKEGESWCKHAVAVALAWIDSGQDPAAVPAPPTQQEPELRVFLEEQESAWLAEQLLRIAADQPAVLARLQAAAGTPSAVDTARDTLYNAITEYLPDPEGWQPGDGGAAWLRQAIDALEDLLEYGYAAEAAALASDAHALFGEVHGGYEDEHSERLWELSQVEID